MRKQGIHTRIRLRRLVVVLGLAVFFLNGIIKLHRHRAIGTMAGCKFVSPNQVIDRIDKCADGNQCCQSEVSDLSSSAIGLHHANLLYWRFSRFNLQLNNNCRDRVAYACSGSLNVHASESKLKCRIIEPAADCKLAGVLVFVPRRLAQSQELRLQFDPAKTTIAFTLGDILHTVHGSFQLKRGDVEYKIAGKSVSGNLIVDATSGQSGNHSRDHKMHKEILESAALSLKSAFVLIAWKGTLRHWALQTFRCTEFFPFTALTTN